MARRKYTRSQAYKDYQLEIVNNPPFNTLPHIRDEKGDLKLNHWGEPDQWMVMENPKKSAKAAALQNTIHRARRAWWEERMAELGIQPPFEGKYASAARQIHPGTKPCLHCGVPFVVGYWYTNKKTPRLFTEAGLEPPDFGTPIDECLEDLIAEVGIERATQLVRGWFPERIATFDEHGISVDAFRATTNTKSTKLSTGYLPNPIVRLDGFHDYANPCQDRTEHERRGRSPANMRKYAHDRRAMRWWAQGDWAAADTLYGSVGVGRCQNDGCTTDKDVLISPDHIGPLACGFCHIPHFGPMCMACNSSKNRRMRVIDVQQLMELEHQGTQVAGWQIQAHWDTNKVLIDSNPKAALLSRSLRSLQDMYLRVLHRVWEAGHARFLAGFLSSQNNLNRYEFVELDPALLTYSDITTTSTNTKNRWSRIGRDVCIAFEDLQAYVSKTAAERNLMRNDYQDNIEAIDSAILRLNEALAAHDLDGTWRDAANIERPRNIRKQEAMNLLGYNDDDELREFTPARMDSDEQAWSMLHNLFNQIGAAAVLDLAELED